jgi:hypothetical protein
MSCRQYRRMLLSREGELSRDEVKALIDHLASCAACSREAVRNSDVERQIRVIRTIPVAGRDPGALTQRILRATATAAPRDALLRGARSKGGLLDHAALPAINFAAAAMLLVVVASALWQAAVVLGEVQELEARQSLQAFNSHPMPTVCYAVDVRQAPETLGPAIALAARTYGAEGTILVSERTLDAVRGGTMTVESYLSRWNLSTRDLGPMRSVRLDQPSMVRPVLSFRYTEGV